MTLQQIETIESNIPMEMPMHDVSITTNVEQARAIQEVQAQMIIAKKFPRDETAAYNSIMKACERVSLAEQAVYRFPRAKQTVEGPSIRLAEVLAMNWENMDYGWEELERLNGRSKCMAYCWDKQRNNRKVIKFEVEHWIEVGKQGSKSRKTLTDPRDIYEQCANQASRRMRACILANIPGDVTEAAVKACKASLARGDKSIPIEDRIRSMVVQFNKIGVSQEMIEEKLGHAVSLMTGEEISDLIPIYKSLYDKQAKRSDFFNTGEIEQELKSSLNEKLSAKKEEVQ